MSRKRLNEIERLIEDMDPNDSRFAALNAEADEINDAIQNVYEAYEARRTEQKKELEAKHAHIRAMLEAGDASAIDVVGVPEFGMDYEIRPESDRYVVYSTVARDDQNNHHVFDTEDKAISKMRKLIWDRLYTKYVRSGEVDQLNHLV